MSHKPVLLLAHGRRAEAQAQRVAKQLSKLGYAVGAGDVTARAELNQAHRVVLLWSRAEARTPALRAAARQAKAGRKLVCVQLDGARPPSDAGAAIALPRSSQDWRRLMTARTPRPLPSEPVRYARKLHAPKARLTKTVEAPVVAPAARAAPKAAPAPKAAAPAPKVAKTAPVAEAATTKRKGAPVLTIAFVILLLAIAGGAATYFLDPGVAAAVNTLVGEAQAALQ